MESRGRFLSLIAVLATVTAGCAASTPSPRDASIISWVFGRHPGATRSKGGPPALAAAASPPRAARATGNPATPVGLVERALAGQGVRFGTDGTVVALWSYMSSRHALVPAASARVGDVVFFDRAGGGRCADHVGLVDAVDDSGRVTFREVRDGAVRRSHFHPTRPVERRDEQGRVINTFLRTKRMDDAPDARYFAGEMVCGVARVRGAD